MHDSRHRYRVVPYGAEHLASAAELARHLSSADARLNAAYLDWKYARNPYIREPLIYLAFDGDSLVGMRGACGSCWEIGSQRFTLPYPDDLVIAPAHRGQGLHQHIMSFAMQDLATRGYGYAVNLSASRATAHGSLKMRWRSCGGVRPLLRRTRRQALVDRIEQGVRASSFVWRWADAVPVLGLPDETHVFRHLEQRLASARQARVSLEQAPRVAEMAQLVRRLPYDGRIRHVRDETYLAWRYANPMRSYRFLYADGERLDGYLVLQRSLGLDCGRVSIVDWEAVDHLVRARLLAAALDGGFPKLYAWGAAGNRSTADLLTRSGFEPARAEYEKSILVRPLRDGDLSGPWMLGGRALDHADDWDLRMIYSMVA